MSRFNYILCTLMAGLLCWAGTVEAGKKRRKAQATLVVVSTADGASVLINGLPAGLTPLAPQKLKAKTYRIRVVKLGHLTFEEKVRLTPGKRTKLLADLMPVSGVVSVGAKLKGAKIYLDGKLKGKAPLDFEMALGSHQLLVSAPGKLDYKKQVRSVPGEVFVLNDALVPDFGDDPLALAPLAPKAEVEEDPMALVPLGEESGDGDDPMALTPLKPVNPKRSPEAPRVDADPLLLKQSIPSIEPWYQTWWAWSGAGVAVVGTAVLTAILMSGEEVPLWPQPDGTIAREPTCKWDEC